jgi:hypothetical protein
MSILAEISLAKKVSSFIIDEVIAPNWNGNLNDSTSPAIIISTINDREWSVLDCNIIKWSLDRLSGSDANKGQVQVASLISLEGIAVIT